jgi:hypothetical protein
MEPRERQYKIVVWIKGRTLMFMHLLTKVF